MIFEKLTKNIAYIKKNGDFSREISGIAYDSRDDCKNKAFICLKGGAFDGHNYIDKARENGAAALIVEDWTNVKEDIPVIQVKSTRDIMAHCANVFYGYPSRDMNLIGITGTNGKTTVSYLIHSIYRASGLKGGLVGTIKCLAGDIEAPVDRTTPESVDLQSMLRKMLLNGIKNCVMEVSSHSVVMKRVAGTVFKTMVFTNLSQDHLDFHGDMDSYYKAKKELFNCPCQKDIINIDDEYGKRLVREIENPVTYGLKGKADFRAEKIELNNNGIKFNLIYPKGQVKIKSQLGGAFNIYNCLAAIAAAYETGFSIDHIKKGVEILQAVPGRLQFIKREPYNIIIDYAHTPDGLENLLKSVKGFTKGKIITVFGCGGDRDRGKRPKMGQIAVSLSDLSIITTDNPRSEEPSLIIKDITNDLSKKNYYIEEDRKKAVIKAIKLAEKGDSVVVAGKGHENYQEIDGVRHPFDDKVIIKKIIGEDV